MSNLRLGSDRGFDFRRLNAMSADLKLIVAAALKDQLTIRSPRSAIAGAVEPFARSP
ncbi:MAG TPA: hypothetical protein VHX39_34915 [Acetobacteraceae bacterium]|nr:hypothetical protein [Acetobacteraceae bacterium]